MKIVIAGGSGFLGQPLARRLVRDLHDVVVLTRALPSGSVVRDPSSDLPRVSRAGWLPDGTLGPWGHLVDGADVVVNLAGESIAARRWSAAHKGRIRESRLLATRSVVAAIRAAKRPPRALVNASAVGYYGDRHDEALSEDSAPGTDFLSETCVAWEHEAGKASSETRRVVLVRTGLALARDGGALPRMALPFKLMAGGPIGSGRQYMPWIHRDDWVELVRFLAEHNLVDGPVNATAPNPVPNADFCRALGRALRRPCLLPAPAFALRLLLGEMADALLLGGQRALPAKAQQLGFQFRYREVDQALEAIYGSG